MTETNWAPASCTLPTVDRPLRAQQFSELFRAALIGARQLSPTTAELDLDAAYEADARNLAARETSCCSFFEFTFITTGDTLTMTITVPAPRTSVLAALIQSAQQDAGWAPSAGAA